MSRPNSRQDRLRLLEQERSYFYRQPTQDDGYRTDAEDYSGIKQRLGISSDGKQRFKSPQLKPKQPSDNEREFESYREDQRQEEPRQLASQKLVDDIFQTRSHVTDERRVFGKQPLKTKVDVFEKMVARDHKSRQKV